MCSLQPSIKHDFKDRLKKSEQHIYNIVFFYNIIKAYKFIFKPKIDDWLYNSISYISLFSCKVKYFFFIFLNSTDLYVLCVTICVCVIYDVKIIDYYVLIYKKFYFETKLEDKYWLEVPSSRRVVYTTLLVLSEN